VRAQVRDACDHLLIGTSLPWLLPRALHDLEAWNEALAAGARGPRSARWSEKLRRAADLEHWAAFRKSFEELADILRSVATRADAPASICVLSGDVHHAYAAEARFPEPVRSRLFQLTCSPLHNFVPKAMRLAFRIAWSGPARRFARSLLRLAGPVPRPSLSWQRSCGPYFGNEIATLVLDGRHGEMVLECSAPRSAPDELREVARLRLAD
jgi:hypothetical protein